MREGGGARERLFFPPPLPPLSLTLLPPSHYKLLHKDDILPYKDDIDIYVSRHAAQVDVDTRTHTHTYI